MKDLGTAASAPGAWGCAASAVPSVEGSGQPVLFFLLLPTPPQTNTFPFLGPPVMMLVTEIGKWGHRGDRGMGKPPGSPPEPHCHLHRVEIIFPFYYTNGKSVQKNQISLFKWKSRAGCSSPLWGVTTCSHYLHWPLCMRSLSVQGWWNTWRWASKSQSNFRSQHRYWRHPVLYIWDLGKTILPISRGKKPNKHLQSFIS